MSDLVVVGDIGGTNSRFALTSRSGQGLEAETHYENQRFATFQDALETYFADVGCRPSAGVVAIAGPVAGDIVGPTNFLRWRFNPEALRRGLGFSELRVINDFEAVAWALPFLSDADIRTIGERQLARPAGNLAVLGPGTGLGVGALVRGEGGRWTAVPSEGGHAEIGAPAGADADVHEIIRRRVGRVSGEHVLSGQGLERIDAALRGLRENEPSLAAAEIGRRALEGMDAVAREAVRLFFDYLARFAGDVALMFGAKGGVFLYGGVCQKLAPLLHAEAFRAAFVAKSPLEPFLEAIPTSLIIAPTPGLEGCAAVARQADSR